MRSPAVLAILLALAAAAPRDLCLASAEPADALEWTQASNAVWSPRGYFGLVATDMDELLLTSGTSPSTVYHDTYRARSNGTGWEPISKSNGIQRWLHAMSLGPISLRTGAASIVVTGGTSAAGGQESTSMISTNRGFSWHTSSIYSVGPGQRADHAQVHLPAGTRDGGVLGATIVCGGFQSGKTLRDCWRLSNTDVDRDWAQVTTTTFPARARAALVRVPQSAASSAAPQLVLMGGSQGGLGGRNPADTPTNDVWASSDGGHSWSQVITSAPWVKRAYHAAVAHPDTGSIYLMGGQARRSPTPLALHDMWSSGDAGRTWSAVTSSAPWLPRHSFGLTIDRNGCMVLAGGQYYPTHTSYKDLDDVWVTPARACFRSFRRV